MNIPAPMTTPLYLDVNKVDQPSNNDDNNDYKKTYKSPCHQLLVLFITKSKSANITLSISLYYT